jgi:hypothetical protein
MWQSWNTWGGGATVTKQDLIRGKLNAEYIPGMLATMQFRIVFSIPLSKKVNINIRKTNFVSTVKRGLSC